MNQWPFVLLLVPAIVVYLYTVIWAARDAEARGKSRLLVALLVAFVQWPIGLGLWMLFRPDTRL